MIGVTAVVNAFVNENYLTGGHGRLTLSFGPIPANSIHLTVSPVIISRVEREAEAYVYPTIHRSTVIKALQGR